VNTAIQELIADLSLWMDWIHPCPDMQAPTTGCRYAQDAFGQRGEFSRLIFRREDEILPGSVRLARRNQEIPCIELGDWIRPPFVEKDDITEATVELARRAFCELNVARLEIRVAEENVRSCHVAERMRVPLESTMRHDMQSLQDNCGIHGCMQ